jgi:pimeloyl-CoA synthetase
MNFIWSENKNIRYTKGKHPRDWTDSRTQDKVRKEDREKKSQDNEAIAGCVAKWNCCMSSLTKSATYVCWL